MKIVATIEARMTSSRLPGKVLLPVLNKPLIGYLIERLNAVKSIDTIVLATTKNTADNILEDYAKSIGIKCFRGNEEDVMSRVIQAAQSVDADIIVEITADCPLIDPNLIEQIIQCYLINDSDYVTNAHVRTFPDGMDVQVFSLNTLLKSASMTNELLDREHVTLHIRNNPKIFKHLNFPAPSYNIWPELGITLDTSEDYNLIKIIIENLYQNNPLFSCFDIIQFLKANPNLTEINKNIIRKGDS